MKELIIAALQKSISDMGINYDGVIEISRPKQKENGDYASNIAIKLFAYDRQEIDLSKGWTVVTDTSVSHTFRSIYYAKVFKIHEHATPGKIDSFVDLQVIYN